MISGSNVVFRRKYNGLRAGQTASQSTLSMESNKPIKSLKSLSLSERLARLAACSKSL